MHLIKSNLNSKSPPSLPPPSPLPQPLSPPPPPSPSSPEPLLKTFFSKSESDPSLYVCNGEPWFDFWALGWLFWALGGIWWASPWARRTLVKFPDSSGSVGGSENQKVVRDTWNCAQCCQKGVAHSTQKLWPKIDFLSIRLLNSPFIGRGAEQLAKQILHWFVCSYCQQYTIWQHCAQFQVSLTTFFNFLNPP